MASKSALLLVAVALSGCAFKPGPEPRAGAEPVNVPVVSKSEFVFDAAAPNGALPRSEAERLDAWFRSLDLRYGDAATASRAINYYRTAPPSATKGLQETTTSKKGQ
ncbi:hypothetical protein [Sphingomonas daechungensis]|uniref:hypothetical protein n=1 Tax=Sphingomonas daechungensis TaxID=1176646 RepID=UPI0037849A84